MKHPIQPLEKDERGDLRFKANRIVQHLLDTHPDCDMNKLAMLYFEDDERQQFAQLIGYSLDGYGSLSYVSDEAYNAAVDMARGRDDSNAHSAAWAAINAYAKMTAQLATCRVAGHSLDTDEVQELRAAKAAVDLELCMLSKENSIGLDANPVAYMAFLSDGPTPIALCEYTGSTELAVLQKVLEVARSEGFTGTAQERMSELGWWVEPVFRRQS